MRQMPVSRHGSSLTNRNQPAFSQITKLAPRMDPFALCRRLVTLLSMIVDSTLDKLRKPAKKGQR
jgi:hypothetical protein